MFSSAARPTAPLALPADIAALLARFGLSLDSLLTEDNPKLNKGAAVARGAILHHLPARALAAAVTPGKVAPTAPRSYLAALAALADREGVAALARQHNGCPWATAGCAAGCLNWAGHGGLSPAVAAARGRRTLAMIAAPHTYGRAVLWAVARQWARAQAEGLPLAVRLRGTDEGPAIGWHRLALTITPAEAQAVARRFGLPLSPGDGVAHTLAAALSVPIAEGTLTLYDYSKAPLSGPLGLSAQRAAGWDVTASLAADRATAAADAMAALGGGFRLAVPVALAKGQALPRTLTIGRPEGPLGEHRFLTVPCVDGDATDHRWRDPAGVAVILRTKRSRGADAALAAPFSLAPMALPQALADGVVTLAW
jgi:hypothetical protein